MERVQKILSNAGYCSRRRAEELIKKGLVSVNGAPITIGDQAGPSDKIMIDGKVLHRERPVYIIFNKPRGCVTAMTDSKFRTVMHYIKCKERVFPVGRLDLNTSGLLLLTNDGTFSNNVMHPRYEVKKTYVAELDRPIGPKNIIKLEKGIMLDNEKTYPAIVNRVHPEKIEITIHEGKNRIVRRMLESLGYNVVRLERTRIGSLSLDGLKQGKYRRVHEPPLMFTLAENPRLKKAVKKKPKKPDDRVHVEGFGYSDSIPAKKASRSLMGKPPRRPFKRPSSAGGRKRFSKIVDKPARRKEWDKGSPRKTSYRKSPQTSSPRKTSSYSRSSPRKTSRPYSGTAYSPSQSSRERPGSGSRMGSSPRKYSGTSSPRKTSSRSGPRKTSYRKSPRKTSRR